MTMSCEDTWDCKTCTTKKCTYVFTKSREYCVDSALTESITGVTSLIAKDFLCKKEKKCKLL